MKRITMTPAEVEATMRAAWDWLWAHRRTDGYRPEHYFTATDLHRRVRAALMERVEDKPVGHYGRDAWGAPLKVSGLGLRECRMWLFRQVQRRVLRADNPSQKGTCTGMRYRPAGDELTDAERATAERKAEVKGRGGITHARTADGKPWCRRAVSNKARFSFRSRKIIRFAKEGCAPTCKRCAAGAPKEVVTNA